MKYLSKIKNWPVNNKKAVLMIAISIATLGYVIINGLIGSNDTTKYVLAKVDRGDITTSVSGTGQISALNEVAITSKTSGDLIYVNAKAGQEVYQGSLLAQIEATDAALELESAKLSYDEVYRANDENLSDAEQTFKKAEEDLASTRLSARSTLATTLADLSDIVSGLEDLRDGYISDSEAFYQSRKVEDMIEKNRELFTGARKTFETTEDSYAALSPKTTDQEIESMISTLVTQSSDLAQAAKSMRDVVVYFKDREDDEDSTTAAEAYSSATELVSNTNTVVSDLLSIKNELASAERTFKNASYDLEDIGVGPDTIDIRSAQLTLNQKQEAYDNHFIRAPFSGLVASVDAKLGDTVSSGTKIATVITKQKIAEISLNEVDAANVKIGQETVLTFDALEDLIITGKVVEIDLIGTVSQGVVNYNAKIGFDIEDSRIKSGMTVNAEIVTAESKDVLRVSTNSIKNRDNDNYVESTSGKTGEDTQSTKIIIGLSNDEWTEVLAGLKEGDTYVAKITASSVTANPQTSSLFGGTSQKTGNGTSRSAVGGAMMIPR